MPVAPEAVPDASHRHGLQPACHSGNAVGGGPAPELQWMNAPTGRAMDAATANPIPTIHHYTTAPGLLGIITSSEIWATDVRFLNDSRELNFAKEMVLSEFDSRPLPPLPDGLQVPTREGLIRDTVAAELSAWDRGFRCYVACFCEEGDLLSQWRGYAAGEGGYSIEFLREELGRERLSGGDYLLELRQVGYGEDEASESFRTLIDFVADERSGHPGTHGWHYARSIILELATLKDQAFREEREWRLVQVLPKYEVVAPDVEMPHAELRFRQGSYGPIPYVGLSIERSSIRGVRVGPGAYAELRRQGAADLLAHHGLGEVPVQLSAAPFRG